MESCRCTSAHHVASSPWATVTANSGPQEAETDLARLQSSKGIRALERLHRRTRTAGGRSHHTLRRGSDLGRQAEVAGNRRPGHRALPFALTASVGASAAPYLPTRGRAEPGRLRASARRSPPPARAGHRSPVWAAGPGGGGPAGAKPRKRAERFSGRVIGAPWRSRELAATATGAATALRTATQVTTRPRREGVAGVVGVGGGVISPPAPATLRGRATGHRRAPAGPQQVEAGRSARGGRGRAGSRGRAGRRGHGAGGAGGPENRSGRAAGARGQVRGAGELWPERRGPTRGTAADGLPSSLIARRERPVMRVL